jgi:hypothetical protein
MIHLEFQSQIIDTTLMDICNCSPPQSSHSAAINDVERTFLILSGRSEGAECVDVSDYGLPFGCLC